MVYFYIGVFMCIIAHYVTSTVQQSQHNDGKGCVYIKTAPSGNITTPNYPERYPSLLSCKWTIKAAPGSVIQLSFDRDALIEHSFSCSSDYMLLYDGKDSSSRLVGRYCGPVFPKLFTSSSNYIYIEFVSDVSLSFRGFNAVYKTISPPTTKPTEWKSQPKFVETPVNQSVIEEETVQLICRVQASPQPIIIWKKQSQNITKNKHVTIVNGPFQSIMTIDKVKLEDNAKYSCIAFNGVGSPIVTDVWLVVKERVLPLIKITSQNQTVQLGSQINLLCNATGKPPMDMRLTGRGHIFHKKTCNNKTCIIIYQKEIWRNTLVRCIISNEAGNTTKLFQINVKGPPIITRAPKNQTVLIGSIANFSCVAIGVPTVQISWFKNNDTAPLQVAGNQSLLQVNATENVRLTCKAADNYGSISRTATLIVKRISIKYVPTTTMTFIEIPKDHPVQLGETTTLKCQAKGFPEPAISWFQDGVNITNQAIFENGISIVQLEFQDKKEIEISCIASNSYEQIESAAHITFHSDLDERSRESGGLDNNKIVIIIVLILIITILFVVIIVVWLRRKKNVDVNSQPDNEANEHLVLTTPCKSKENCNAEQGIETLNISQETIVHCKDLNNGLDVHMYLGDVTNPPFTRPGNYRVVVRVLKDMTPCEEKIDEFAIEASLLVNLVHPNVVRLMAVCIKTNPLALVFEYSELGFLDQFLRDRDPNKSRDQTDNEQQTTLDIVERISMAKQIAAGMQYLVGKNYIHQELRACNCMVFKNSQVKIANLGLRWVAPERNYFDLEPEEKQYFPIRWLSPEVIMYGSYSTSSDVWSYGVVVWEIFSHGQLPYTGLDENDVVTFVRGRNVLPRPKICPNDLYDLVRSCWEVTPLERPTFSFLHQAMTSFHELVPQIKT